MAYAYKHLNAADRAAIEKRISERDARPVVDDALRRAWEADMYAHSLLADAAADPDERQEHLDAMATIEAALTAPRTAAGE